MCIANGGATIMYGKGRRKETVKVVGLLQFRGWSFPSSNANTRYSFLLSSIFAIAKGQERGGRGKMAVLASIRRPSCKPTFRSFFILQLANSQTANRAAGDASVKPGTAFLCGHPCILHSDVYNRVGWSQPLLQVEQVDKVQQMQIPPQGCVCFAASG